MSELAKRVAPVRPVPTITLSAGGAHRGGERVTDGVWVRGAVAAAVRVREAGGVALRVRVALPVRDTTIGGADGVGKTGREPFPVQNAPGAVLQSGVVQIYASKIAPAPI